VKRKWRGKWRGIIKGNEGNEGVQSALHSCINIIMKCLMSYSYYMLIKNKNSAVTTIYPQENE
jgi:hypothetical protein